MHGHHISSEFLLSEQIIHKVSKTSLTYGRIDIDIYKGLLANSFDGLRKHRKHSEYTTYMDRSKTKGTEGAIFVTY